MRILLTVATLVAAMSLSCLSLPAIADDAAAIGSTPAQIRSAQAELRQAIERKSGSYAQFSDDERKEIFARQDRVLILIEGRENVDELGPDGRIELANALAAVDAAVTRAEDNRMICERIKPVGSNRPQNKCMTVAQRRKLREQAERQTSREP